MLLVVLIGCVTVFQCHHHDAAGNAYFLAMGAGDVTPDMRHADCHGEGGGTGHSGPTAGCGFHVDVAPLIDKACDCISYSHAYVFIVSDCDFDFGQEQIIADLLCDEESAGDVAAGYSRVGLLRGPPCV